MSTLDRLAQWWIDRNVRSPRLPGFSIDEGLPDRGQRYGGAQTIHNTGTVDVVLHDGVVTEVWFRCKMLPFNVSDYGYGNNLSWSEADHYGNTQELGSLVAVELVYDD